jgi:hypothetical protein
MLLGKNGFGDPVKVVDLEIVKLRGSMKGNIKPVEGPGVGGEIPGVSLQVTGAPAENTQRPRVLAGEAPTASLVLNFRGAPLDSVLDYLCEVAGLAVHLGSGVKTTRPIDLRKSEPATLPDAVELLERALRDQGYTAFHKGRTLTVLSNHEAKKYCLPLPTLACTSLSA